MKYELSRLDKEGDWQCFEHSTVCLGLGECLSILTFLFVRTKRKVTKEKNAGSRSGATNLRFFLNDTKLSRFARSNKVSFLTEKAQIFFTLLHYMPEICHADGTPSCSGGFASCR